MEIHEKKHQKESKVRPPFSAFPRENAAKAFLFFPAAANAFLRPLLCYTAELLASWECKRKGGSGGREGALYPVSSMSATQPWVI